MSQKIPMASRLTNKDKTSVVNHSREMRRWHLYNEEGAQIHESWVLSAYQQVIVHKT